MTVQTLAQKAATAAAFLRKQAEDAAQATFQRQPDMDAAAAIAEVVAALAADRQEISTPPFQVTVQPDAPV